MVEGADQARHKEDYGVKVVIIDSGIQFGACICTISNIATQKHYTRRQMHSIYSNTAIQRHYTQVHDVNCLTLQHRDDMAELASTPL